MNRRRREGSMTVLYTAPLLRARPLSAVAALMLALSRDAHWWHGWLTALLVECADGKVEARA